MNAEQAHIPVESELSWQTTSYGFQNVPGFDLIGLEVDGVHIPNGRLKDDGNERKSFGRQGMKADELKVNI